MTTAAPAGELLTSTVTDVFAPDWVVALTVCVPLVSLVVSRSARRPDVLPGSPEMTKVRACLSSFAELPQVPSPKL